MNVLQGSHDAQIGSMVNYHVEGGLHQYGSNASEGSLSNILRPITDASHTRDRKQSPPDSACFPGTRLEVVEKVNAWTRGKIKTRSQPHIRWMHGYVGCGKSSISQEVCDTSRREGRPVVSFFFFRNAGDRSKIWRLATTLASQMAVAIPETEPIIRAGVQANPALLAPDKGGVSLQARMECLVYAPFKAAVQGKSKFGLRTRMKRMVYGPLKAAIEGETKLGALARGPFLIVLDGLDECDNKDEIQELIDGMLLFFNDNPLIPLRIFITSRVEEHIQSRLNVPAVMMDNLVDHCSNDDIATFLQILFEDACRRNSVVRAYVRQHGEWPAQSDRRKLVEHIGGSFIFASAVFKFIMGANTEGNDGTTPMDRLPLALKMNPGLDGLYVQTLARSKHLPHFPDIISTIALLKTPLSTSGIAEILGIHTYEVINVLVNLQAVIQVPGTDDIPVTLCHTSLRDFLTTQGRSHDFFAHPSHHVRLYLRCLECQFKHLRQDPELFIRPRDQIPPVARYALQYSREHSYQGLRCFKPSELNSAIQLCREGLALQPGTPELIQDLAGVVCWRAFNSRSLMDWNEAISLYRAVLELRPPPHPDRSTSLHNLGSALLNRQWRTDTMTDLEEAIPLVREALELPTLPHPDRSLSLNALGDALRRCHRRTGIMADLEEAISLHREALELRPSRHPDRSLSLDDLGNALLDHHRLTGIMADIEEAISLHREALELRPPPHPDRSDSLNNLGNALLALHSRTGTMADLEEAISHYREAFELQPSPHPDRSALLYNLALSLRIMYKATCTLSHLQEAIAHREELLEVHFTVGHRDRADCLLELGDLLQMRFDATGQAEDLSKIATLKEEANCLSASSTGSTS